MWKTEDKFSDFEYFDTVRVPGHRCSLASGRGGGHGAHVRSQMQIKAAVHSAGLWVVCCTVSTALCPTLLLRPKISRTLSGSFGSFILWGVLHARCCDLNCIPIGIGGILCSGTQTGTRRMARALT